jgi:Protein of unknown function (DUF2975)
MSLAPASTVQAGNDVLRRRVAPLCHAIRLSALAWIIWASVGTLSVFGSPARVAEHFGRVLNVDLTNLPTSGYAMALTIILVDLAIAWLIVVFIWRLFGHYLRGEIFSLAAVQDLGRAGWTGVAAVVADIVARPLIAYALTQHLGESQRHHFWTNPNDLLHLLLALFIVALAHIFRVGVAIADENRQIV